MSDSHPETTAPPTTIAQRAFRLAMLCGLMWLGVNTATSIKTLLTPRPILRNEFLTVDTNVTLLPAEGSWRLNDSHTKLATSTTNFPNLSSEVSRHDGTLTIDQPTLKAFVEMNENSVVSAATLAMKVEKQWQVLTVGPADAQQTTPHLLPLTTSQRVCGRWSDDDRLLLEIVSLNSSRGELLAAWRKAGWQIRHTAWGGLDSFSFLCVKDGQVVYAWSQQPLKIESLLLSRSPDATVRGTTSHHGKQS
jgi:hypothetical protein